MHGIAKSTCRDRTDSMNTAYVNIRPIIFVSRFTLNFYFANHVSHYFSAAPWMELEIYPCARESNVKIV